MRYNAQEKSEALRRKRLRYEASEKGKATKALYDSSPECEVSRERYRARYRTSPKGRACKARKRARRRATIKALIVNDLTAAQWAAILEEYDHSCCYCEASNVELTMDHVVPLSKGGQHTAGNIVPACRSCNSSKGSRI